MPDFLVTTHPYVRNPFGVVGVVGGGLTTYGLFGASRVLGLALLLMSTTISLFAPVLRLLHARSGRERQQIEWFLFATVSLTMVLGLLELDILVRTYTFDFGYRNLALLSSLRVVTVVIFVGALAQLAVPIFTYIAVLRHNLYDMDVVINRTLVYGALTACTVGIYVLAVVGLGYLFQAQGNLAVSLSATGPVAVVFQPLRGRLQRGVNRLMYGERDDPYAVISRLGKRLEAAIEPEGRATDRGGDHSTGSQAALRGRLAGGGWPVQNSGVLWVSHGRTGSPPACVSARRDRTPRALTKVARGRIFGPKTRPARGPRQADGGSRACREADRRSATLARTAGRNAGGGEATLEARPARRPWRSTGLLERSGGDAPSPHPAKS